MAVASRYDEDWRRESDCSVLVAAETVTVRWIQRDHSVFR